MTFEEARAGLARTLEMARAGKHLQALAEARAVVAVCPRDVNLLHQAGLVLQTGGAHDDALRLFHEALGLLPDFHYTEMEIGNTLAAMRRLDDAFLWYLKAARSEPSYILAYLRAAEVLRDLGRHSQALDLLQQAHARDPTDPQVCVEFADLLVFHNRRTEAADVFGALVAAGRLRQADTTRYLLLLTEIGRFSSVAEMTAAMPESAASPDGYRAIVLAGNAALAALLDRPSLVASARQRQAGDRWMDTAAVVASVRTAIMERRPLSLIRVGDGEARFLAFCDPRLRGRLSAAQAELLGDVSFRNWFGQPIAAADPQETTRLHAATISAIEQADILGVSSADRLESDNLHFGYLGHLEGLVSSVARTEPGIRLTDAMVHIDLHRHSPFYRDILERLDFLGVISPHPGLALRLARRHGISDVAEYLLPGESRLPDGQQNRHGRPHFPDIYREVCRCIKVPRSGALFIVAGGLLGKIYCSIIRQRGGVAIDVGSIVDAWMGINTRPGVFDRPADWVLPNEG
jgi:tetratricopeptide (TPR) repeat protein